VSKHEQQPAHDPSPNVEGWTDQVWDAEPVSAEAEALKEESEQAAAQAADPDSGTDATASGPIGEQPRTAATQPSDAETVADAPIVAAKISELEELVSERTADLQRLQAEYANYKKRVDRDRSLARQGGVEAVVLDLLPVLDSIEAAREHDELTGGFKLVAEELERLTGKYGLSVYGEVGEPFDPNVHEALMHVPLAGVEVATVSAIMQKGVRLNERVLRPARVGIAEPE